MWFQGFSPLPVGASRQDHAFQPPPPPPWPGKSHEAEDVTLGSSPQIHVTQCSSSSDEKLDEPGRGADGDEARRSRAAAAASRAFPLELAQDPVRLPVKQMSKYSHSLAKGSPPPRVLLHSLRSPRSGKDPAPVRASHDSHIVAQVQRGGRGPAGPCGAGGDSAEGGLYPSHSFDAARSMEAINDAEYIAVRPKLTIIRREESIHSNVSSYSSGSGGSGAGRGDSLSSLTLSSSPSGRSTSSTSSSGGSGSTLGADSARPSHPPAYTAALQRKFMLDHDLPVDVSPAPDVSPVRISQRKANEKAKILYEESLQKYLQDRYEQKHTGPGGAATRKISDPGAPTTSSAIVGREGLHGDCSFGGSPCGDAVTSREDLARSQPLARKLYDESLQRYEQQQTAPVDASQQDSGSDTASSRNVQSVSESGAHRRVVDTSSESATQHNSVRCVRESRTHQRSSEFSERRTSVTKNSRPKSMLEIPFSNLHRSLSDSADRLNKLGHWNSHSRSEVRDSEKNSEHRDSVKSEERVDVSQSARRKVSEAAVHERRGVGEGSASRHYFRTSCFSHPEDSPRSASSSPASGSPRTLSPRRDLHARRYPRADNAAVHSPRVDTSAVKSPRVDHSVVGSRWVDDSAAARPTRSQSPVLRVQRTSVTNASSAVHGSGGVSSSVSAGRSNSGASSESTNTGAVAALSHPVAAGSGGKSKTELGWSVKNLMKIYSADSAQGPEQQPLAESPRAGPPDPSPRPGPPPYQDPPPFRRLQDGSRLSTSSNSSHGSSGTGRSASPASRGSGPSGTRLGPQGVGLDYSSSEDLTYHNSRWSRARSESGSGQSDQEMTNAFTDISYV